MDCSRFCCSSVKYSLRDRIRQGSLSFLAEFTRDM